MVSSVVSSSPAGMSVHARDMDVVDEVCRSTLGCVQPDLLSGLLVFVVSGVLTFVIVATIVHLADARSTVDEERSRTVAERDAFAAFAARVSNLDAEAPAARAMPAAGTVTLAGTRSEPASSRELERVKDAYRDTVMAVPHYEEDYDEPLAVNLAAEFGGELATAVVDGSALTPELREALVRRSSEARDRRDEFMTTLDREAAELEEARTSLRSVDDALGRIANRPMTDRSFDELAESWKRLGDLEERCHRLLRDRQARIHETAPDGTGRSSDAPSLQAYLYGSLPVAHPVLADGVALVDRLRTARSGVLRALTRRV